MKKIISIVLIVTFIFAMGVLVHASEEVHADGWETAIVINDPIGVLCPACERGTVPINGVSTLHTHEFTQACLYSANELDTVIQYTRCNVSKCNNGCGYKICWSKVVLNTEGPICGH